MSGGGESAVRVGIAGGNAERGWARDAHVPALRQLSGLEIAAVSARSQAGAEAAAADFGADAAFGDTLAMARDPGVDLVAVTCKVPEHRAIVLAAAEAGKAIYCEWPLGRDAAEAGELADAARKAGVLAVCGMQGPASRAVREAARLVRDGAVGKPLTLRVISTTMGWGDMAPAFYAYLQDRANGATLLSIPGGHTLAMVEAVVGPFTALAAQTAILRPEMAVMGSDETIARTCADHVHVLGEHASGCLSTVEIAGGTDRPLTFELRGETGTLEIRGHHLGGYQCAELSVWHDGREVALPAPPAAGLEGPADNVAMLYAGIAARMAGGEADLPGFDDAVRLTRLLDLVEQSAAERRWVDVPPA